MTSSRPSGPTSSRSDESRCVVRLLGRERRCHREPEGPEDDSRGDVLQTEEATIAVSGRQSRRAQKPPALTPSLPSDFLPAMPFEALESPPRQVLTACLSRGWVHEFPGTCPESPETWRKLARELAASPRPHAPPRSACHGWATVSWRAPG